MVKKIIELETKETTLTIYEGDECNMPDCHVQAKHIIMTEDNCNFFCDKCYENLNKKKYEEFVKQPIIAEI